MANPARKQSNDAEARRDQQRMEEREKWQKEYIARQELIKNQVEHRRQLRRVPKAAWIFMAVWGGVLFFAGLLFVMSFNPSTSNLVNKIISSFKVF